MPRPKGSGTGGETSSVTRYPRWLLDEHSSARFTTPSDCAFARLQRGCLTSPMRAFRVEEEFLVGPTHQKISNKGAVKFSVAFDHFLLAPWAIHGDSNDVEVCLEVVRSETAYRGRACASTAGACARRIDACASSAATGAKSAATCARSAVVWPKAADACARVDGSCAKSADTRPKCEDTCARVADARAKSAATCAHFSARLPQSSAT